MYSADAGDGAAAAAAAAARPPPAHLSVAHAGLCKWFVNHGVCHRGESCPLVHTVSPEAKLAWVKARRKTRRQARGDEAHGDDKGKPYRASQFADWLIATFGVEALRTGTGVLDVAGGRGDVSFELHTKRGIPCTLVEPRPRKLSRLQHAYMRAHPDATLCEHAQALFSAELWPRFAQCSVVVGMHPDQATEPIVDAALALGKPFAVVPCCVFPQLYPLRRVPDPAAPGGLGARRVATRDDLVSWLRHRGGASAATNRLAVDGANVVVFRRDPGVASGVADGTEGGTTNGEPVLCAACDEPDAEAAELASSPRGGAEVGGGGSTAIVVSGEPPEVPCVDVILPGLLLGNEAAAHSRHCLSQHSVVAILNATPTSNPHERLLERRLGAAALMQVPVEDSRAADLFPYFQACCGFIDEHVGRSSGGNVLVHCHQGTSRSVSVVLAYLMWASQREGAEPAARLTLRDAFNYVLDHRPGGSPYTHPNSGFLMQLVSWEKHLGLALEAPSLEFREYAREAASAWSGRNRGPCTQPGCRCGAIERNLM